MKTLKPTLWAALILAASSTTMALPVSMTEITIYDGDGTGSGYAQEDQETEPGTINDQSWDIESFFSYGTNQIGIISGFNLTNNLGGDRRSGDIFIDINGDHVAGNATGPNGQTNVANTFGYDYVLDINWSNNTYNAIQLAPGAIVTTTTTYGINYGSNPWAYVSGGTLLGSGSFTTQSGLSDAQTGKTGGTHNAAFGFDLSFLASNTNYVVHFTQSCGNDNLMGQSTTSEVPVPAAAWLMGSSLLGLVGLKRRKVK
jgi:hypothetical protein